MMGKTFPCGSFILTNFLFFLPLGIMATAMWARESQFDDKLPPFDIYNMWNSSERVHFTGACAILCEKTACAGFFYNAESKECILTKAVPLLAGIYASGFRYYSKMQFRACPANANNLLHEQSGTCFMLSDNRQTWVKAKDTCQQENARLAVLDTTDKEDFLIEFFRSGNLSTADCYFIGAHRPYDKWNTTLPPAHDYIWLNGNPVVKSPQHWAGSEPNNINTRENVIFIWHHPTDGWTFGDVREWDRSRYICEFSLYENINALASGGM
ncbi:uncharacterized protein [Littorina saxatilis]|uniref:C-type lectin domain-containing protein n=1 Tax=Littorina saxatilis TaxID=31220 RepID=A0AAN9GD97_9CAEN